MKVVRRLAILLFMAALHGDVTAQSLAMRGTWFKGAGGSIVASPARNDRSANQIGPGWGFGTYFTSQGEVNFLGVELGVEKQTWEQRFVGSNKLPYNSNGTLEHQGVTRRDYMILRISPQLGAHVTERYRFMVGFDIGLITNCRTHTYGNAVEYENGNNHGTSSGEVVDQFDSTYTGLPGTNGFQFGLHLENDLRVAGNLSAGFGVSLSFSEFRSPSNYGIGQRPGYFRVFVGWDIWNKERAQARRSSLLKTPPDR